MPNRHAENGLWIRALPAGSNGDENQVVVVHEFFAYQM
jgi:hypothetical protein